MKTFYIKRGETFKVTISLKDSDNLPINLPVENISSQLRDNSGNLIDNFVIVKTETIGDYLFSLVDTSNYPIENLSFDIKIKNQSNEIVYSQTMSLSVLQSQTENPEEISLYTLKVEVNLLTERLNELEPKVETNIEEINHLKECCEEVNSTLEQIESNITNLQNKDEELETSISENTNSINTINQTIIPNLDDRIEVNETNIGNLQTGLTDVREVIHTMDSNIILNSQNISTLQTSVSNNSSDISTLQSSNTQTSQSIQTINSGITSLESRVSSLENGGNLSQLTSDVNNLKLSVQTLETNFTDQEIENIVNSVFQPHLND